MQYEIKGHFRNGEWQEPTTKEIDMDNDAHGLFKEPMTAAESKDKWLGDGNAFYERFPTCGLNEKQVATLVGFSGIRVSGLGVSPAIHRLTESGIVEVSVRWDSTSFGAGGELWMADNGEYIAAAMWEGPSPSDRGPMKVYRWLPMRAGQGFRSFNERAEELSYPQSETSNGSTEATRAFIKEHWMGVTT